MAVDEVIFLKEENIAKDLCLILHFLCHCCKCLLCPQLITSITSWPAPAYKFCLPLHPSLDFLKVYEKQEIRQCKNRLNSVR